MPTVENANATRQARHKAKLADAGLKQLNVTAPEPVHAVLKEIASRTRVGESLADVLVSVAQRTAGASLFKVEAKAEALHATLESLPPAPLGKVNIAVRLSQSASGAVRKKLHALGLTYANRVFAGAVDGSIKDRLKAQVQDNGGTLVC